MRSDWAELEYNFENLEEVYLDIFELRNLANRFYNLCQLRKDENNLLNLLEAKTIFESCLVKIKSLIEPGENELIDKVNDKRGSFDILENYLGNLLAMLDVKIGEFSENMIKTESERVIVIPIKIHSFRENLLSVMKNLILFPLKNSYKVYNQKIRTIDFEGVSYSKKEIFEYILFREVYLSAKMSGSPIRQKASMSGKSIHFDERNVFESPKNVSSKGKEQSGSAEHTPLGIEEIVPELFPKDDNSDNELEDKNEV